MSHDGRQALLSVPIVMVLLAQSACHVQSGRRERSEFSLGVSSDLNSSVTSFSGQPSFPQTSTIDQGRDDAGDASQELPVFVLTVDGRAIAKDREIRGSLRVIEEHGGSHRDLASREASIESAVALAIHGESSVGLAKKSYQLELRDDQHESREASLLGLPAGSDWVLHGCGADRTCMRNVLGYALGRAFGRYAPRTRYVELFIDQKYQGIYVLVERIRRDKDRVDLPRPATAADGDLTGGYIFKMDLAEGTPADAVPRDWISPATQTIYSYYYPRFNQITPAQKTYLHQHVTAFETMMLGAGWNNRESGYRRWLDLPSWVDFALMQELSVNPDAYFKSVYFQKLPQSMGGRIALGPFWDFDLAFGAAEFRDARNTRTWAHRMNRFGGEPVPYNPPGRQPYVPMHWERLWTDPAFHDDLRCRWQQLRGGPLRMSALEDAIDGWADELKRAQPRDGALWGNPPANAFGEEIASLKKFLRDRTTWMDSNLSGCSAL